jgi:general secretion pathway protein G
VREALVGLFSKGLSAGHQNAVRKEIEMKSGKYKRRCDRNSNCSHASKGFTLLELLVVMVIIGLLVGYVGPLYFKQLGKSEVKVARAQIDAIGKALDQYRLDNGQFPSTEQGLTALVLKPANEKRWDGPYLKKAVPPDPWGNVYIYKQPGDHGEYDLLSYGKDGILGGIGDAADIVNWE